MSSLSITRRMRLCHNVFARESSNRSNLVSNRRCRDCHVHCRELAMTTEDCDTVSNAGVRHDNKYFPAPGGRELKGGGLNKIVSPSLNPSTLKGTSKRGGKQELDCRVIRESGALFQLLKYSPVHLQDLIKTLIPVIPLLITNSLKPTCGGMGFPQS